MIVAGTGHRPENCEVESEVRTKARVKLQYPSRQGKSASTFICGMAAGFDLWAGDEALNLGIEVIAARPWAGHPARRADRELYARLLDEAIKVVNVVESKEYPGVWVYHNRDKWMVDNCDAVMAYWNGWEAGGTWGTVNYAKKVGKPIANIYHDPPF